MIERKLDAMPPRDRKKRRDYVHSSHYEDTLYRIRSRSRSRSRDRGRRIFSEARVTGDGERYGLADTSVTRKDYISRSRSSESYRS